MPYKKPSIGYKIRHLPQLLGWRFFWKPRERPDPPPEALLVGFVAGLSIAMTALGAATIIRAIIV